VLRDGPKTGAARLGVAEDGRFAAEAVEAVVRDAGEVKMGSAMSIWERSRRR
jgi:hypothetical protein